MTFNIQSFNKHGVIAGVSGSGKTNTIKLLTNLLLVNEIDVIILDKKDDLHHSFNTTIMNHVTACEHLNMDITDAPLSISGFDIDNSLLTNDDWGIVLNLSPAQKRAFITETRGKGEKIKTICLKYIDSVPVETSTKTMVEKVKQFAEDAPFTYNFGGTHLSGSNVIRCANIKSRASYFTLVLSLMNDAMVGEESKTLKKVIFIDEAHLLFSLDRNITEEHITLIRAKINMLRSKGVGVFFVSQSLSHIDKEVVKQCSTLIQHRLNSPSDKEDLERIKTTASIFAYVASKSFCPKEIKTFTDMFFHAILSMNTGEALVKTLDEKGNVTPPFKIQFTEVL